MKFTITKKILSEAIGIVSKAVPSIAKIEALKGIYLDVTHEGINLIGNNAEFALMHYVPAVHGEVIQITVEEPGRIVLPHPYFQQIVTKLRGEEVSIQVNDKFVATISSTTPGKKEKKGATSIHTLSALNSDDYPRLPDVQREKVLSMSCDLLRSAIRSTLFAIANNNIRPILTGVNFLYDNNMLILVATDSYRLSRREIKLSANIDSFQSVVPGSSLKELVKVLPEDGTQAELYLANNYMLVSFGQTTFLTRLLEGTYPDTNRILPQSHKTEIVVNTKEFEDAVNSCNIFKEDSTTVIRFSSSFEESSIKLVAVEKQVGKAEELIFFEDASGEDIKISFNARYVLNALDAMEKPKKVRLSFGGTMLPFTLKPEGREDITQLVLPVRTVE